jgi:hypothetical protein
VLRLLARAIREADDRESGHAGLKVRLDLDPSRLETDESMGDRASEHPPTVGTEASTNVDASVPIRSKLYGV